MERYKIITKLGEGSFGCVWKAINEESGEVVAVKRIKTQYYSWEECLHLAEIKSLWKMKHPNIIKLEEVIREHNILYLVFEFMDCNLHQLMKCRGKPFPEAEVKTVCVQVFQGLAYMHKQGYFHRDLKPENLLVSENASKIGDLGSAREINSQPPYTHYVTTRWYRAPEVMLRSNVYGAAVDMWAMGAIMAELFTSRALFPGTSTMDQLYRICSVIGTPTHNNWNEGIKLANALNYNFPLCEAVPLSVLIPSASEDAINLITKLCSWDPYKRPTALEALQHPFFQSCFHVPPSIVFRGPMNKVSTSVVTMTVSEKKSLPKRLPPNSKPPGFYYPANPRISTRVATTAVSENKSFPRRLPPNSKPPGFNYPVNSRVSIRGPPVKVDVNNKGNNVNHNSSKVAAEPEPIYHPPATNIPAKFYHVEIIKRDSDVTELLENVKMDLRVPPMMTGRSWIGPVQLGPLNRRPGDLFSNNVY